MHELNLQGPRQYIASDHPCAQAISNQSVQKCQRIVWCRISAKAKPAGFNRQIGTQADGLFTLVSNDNRTEVGDGPDADTLEPDF